MSDAHDEPTGAIAATDYSGPERRKEYLQWRREVDRRLDKGAETMRELRKEIAANTKVTESVQTDTSELVALLQSFKGAFKVLEILGKLTKPLGYIVALVGGVLGLVAIVKGGGTPK